MVESLPVLLMSTVAIGFLHVIIGPDHYLPFILLGKSNHWSMKKTVGITFVCGVGHVLSSVVIGLIGIAVGVAVASLQGVESVRGEIASWSLIAFGTVYAIWGLYHAYKHPHHTHSHHHLDGSEHEHNHAHEDGHHHLHIDEKKKRTIFWTIFIVFVLGPCEPMIPLVMYPAIYYDWPGIILVTLIFSSITIGMMLLLVCLGAYGIMKLDFHCLERYAHFLAGAIIAASGLLIILLGV
jgi:nickel/cobalt exporter